MPNRNTFASCNSQVWEDFGACGLEHQAGILTGMKAIARLLLVLSLLTPFAAAEKSVTVFAKLDK